MEEKELADRLSAYKAGLTDEEIRQIVAETKALREYQEMEDTPEDLAKDTVVEARGHEKGSGGFRE